MKCRSDVIFVAILTLLVAACTGSGTTGPDDVESRDVIDDGLEMELSDTSDGSGDVERDAVEDSGSDATDPEDVVDDSGGDGDDGDVADATLAKGDSIGMFWNTYYYLAYEENYSGADDTTVYAPGCTELTRVPSEYAEALCIEGSGKLDDGTVINYYERCSCGGACNICFSEMDPNQFPWGKGSRGNALEPLRSWAVDTDIIDHGTVLYVEEWDGVEIPAVDGLGGFTHDGCFRADDVGGGIDGMHFDFFAGTPDMRQALEQIYPTRSEFEVYVNSERCLVGG